MTPLEIDALLRTLNTPALRLSPTTPEETWASVVWEKWIEDHGGTPRLPYQHPATRLLCLSDEEQGRVLSAWAEGLREVARGTFSTVPSSFHLREEKRFRRLLADAPAAPQRPDRGRAWVADYDGFREMVAPPMRDHTIPIDTCDEIRSVTRWRHVLNLYTTGRLVDARGAVVQFCEAHFPMPMQRLYDPLDQAWIRSLAFAPL